MTDLQTPPEGALGGLQTGWRRTVPLVLQTEAAECGLACLAMVLGFHGSVVDLASLRARHGATPQGMTLEDLARVATAEQLTSRAVRLEPQEVAQLNLPCILHWDMGHFVVLTEVRAGHCRVIDPALGEQRISAEELSRRFSGVALELWPAATFVPREQVQPVSLGQLVGRVTGVWASVWRVLSLSLLLEALALLTPLFTQWIVDHVIVSRDLDLLTTLGVGFVLVLLLQQVFTMMRALLVLRLGTQLKVQWRSNVLAHLLRLPLEYFTRRHLGDVLSRYNAINHIQQVLTASFVEAALDGLMVLVTLALMLAYSPMLTAVAVVAVALYVLVRALRYAPLRDATAERLVREAQETSHLLESVRGIRSLRLFAREPQRVAAWQSLMVAEVNAGLRAQRLEIVFSAARRTLTGLAALLLLWLGAREVMGGALSVGMLLAFLSYRGQFDGRFGELVNKWFDFKMLRLDAQRLADIVQTPTEPQGPAEGQGAVAAPLTDAPTLQLSNLHFSYAPGSPKVLDGLDLTVPAGQAVAITGPSGCGKTTLLNLLLGVYTAQQGEIRINGSPLSAFGLARWRASIGTVLQDDSLFAGSIADNICFFDPRPDTQRIEACARMAAVHDDIARLPMGYMTLVGDMGTSLSGGQRQRVLLARALYRQPQVLVLDEATSHLDLACEAQVGQAVASWRATRLIVAHRPQTLALADRVVELDQGRIVRDETAADYARRVGLPQVRP